MTTRWLAVLRLLFPGALAACGGGGGSTPPAAFGAPVLLRKEGGCSASWCQTGWYGSPAVADVDGDGALEVVWASDDLVPLKAAPRGGRRNGALGGPTLANLDAGPELEVPVGTVASGVVACRIPGSVSTGIRRGTGRGTSRRDGTGPVAGTPHQRPCSGAARDHCAKGHLMRSTQAAPAAMTSPRGRDGR